MLVAILTWRLPYASTLSKIHWILACELDFPILRPRRLRHRDSWQLFSGQACNDALNPGRTAPEAMLLVLIVLHLSKGLQACLVTCRRSLTNWITQKTNLSEKAIRLPRSVGSIYCQQLDRLRSAWDPGLGPVSSVWELELTWPVASPAPRDWTPLPSPSSPSSLLLLCSLLWGDDSKTRSSEVFPESGSLEY